MSNRVDRIMARVQEWADENAGWDVSDEVRANLEFIITQPEFSGMTDDELFEESCLTWQMAE
jgi:hypothetical protein